ncbi:MAG: hypothetical protein AAGB48_01075 [Planctomycetota bacterium]
MSQLEAPSGPLASLSRVVTRDRRLTADNLTLPAGGGTGLATVFAAIGLIGIVLTIIGSQVVGKDGAGARYAMGAYHIGFTVALGLSLGSMFWVMIFHIIGTKWSVTIRRQFEHVMRAMWVCMILFLPIAIIETLSQGLLFKWMDPSVTADDAIYEHKSGYLNVPFFLLRAAIYFGLWVLLATMFWNWQRQQDETADRWLSNKARFTSAWGLLVFGVTVAFAGFDWLMSMDYHFFSTMWGVYFFAGAAYSAMALNIIITSLLRGSGRLEGVVTVEHGHDQAKLLFAFTVFWAYIAFSQYFLIWYGNIPEETRYFDYRQEQYPIATAVLILGHFILPFLFLLPRTAKRRTGYVAFFAGCALAIHVLDIWWIIRPMADAKLISSGKLEAPKGIGVAWLDLAGIVGVLGIFAAVVVRNVFSGPLIPVNDPRLPRCLDHKNYV